MGHNPAVAVLLSVVWPGAGHVYLGMVYGIGLGLVHVINFLVWSQEFFQVFLKSLVGEPPADPSPVLVYSQMLWLAMVVGASIHCYKLAKGLRAAPVPVALIAPGGATRGPNATNVRKTTFSRIK